MRRQIRLNELHLSRSLRLIVMTGRRRPVLEIRRIGGRWRRRRRIELHGRRGRQKTRRVLLLLLKVTQRFRNRMPADRGAGTTKIGEIICRTVHRRRRRRRRLGRQAR